MNDSIGTNGAVCWLERIQCAVYERICSSVAAGDTVEVGKWLDCLERLGVI